jgi:hypothetical protein
VLAQSAVQTFGTPQAFGGRGIGLVDARANDWPVASIADGKQVWFRLSVGPRMVVSDSLSLRRVESRLGSARVGPFRACGRR